MKGIKKFSVILLIFSVLAFAFSLTLSAAPVYPRVVDNADLLSASEEAELTKKLDSLSEKYEQDIVVVTTDSLDGKWPSAYAREFYEAGGYGYGDTYSGILLLVSMEERDYYILTSGEALDIFGEGDLISVEDAFLDYLSGGDYYEAFDAFADESANIIEYDGRLTPIWIFISIAVGALIAGIAVWKMMSKHKGVKMQKTANNYMLHDTFRLERSRDVYLYSHVTRVQKPQNNSSGRSGGGRSYGGRGGKF